MLEFLIAMSAPTYQFDYGLLAERVRTVWPDAFFAPSTSPEQQRVSVGQWQIPSRGSRDELALVSPQPDGTAIGIDSYSLELAARYIALVTTLPGFPDDGTALLLNWNGGEYEPLRPNMTSTVILAIRRR